MKIYFHEAKQLGLDYIVLEMDAVTPPGMDVESDLPSSTKTSDQIKTEADLFKAMGDFLDGRELLMPLSSDAMKSEIRRLKFKYTTEITAGFEETFYNRFIKPYYSQWSQFIPNTTNNFFSMVQNQASKGKCIETEFSAKVGSLEFSTDESVRFRHDKAARYYYFFTGNVATMQLYNEIGLSTLKLKNFIDNGVIKVSEEKIADSSGGQSNWHRIKILKTDKDALSEVAAIVFDVIKRKSPDMLGGARTADGFTHLLESGYARNMASPFRIGSPSAGLSTKSPSGALSPRQPRSKLPRTSSSFIKKKSSANQLKSPNDGSPKQAKSLKSPDDDRSDSPRQAQSTPTLGRLSKLAKFFRFDESGEKEKPSKKKGGSDDKPANDGPPKRHHPKS